MIPYFKILGIVCLSTLLLACASTESRLGHDQSKPRYSAEFKRAIAAMQAGDFETAKTALESITESAPNYTGPWTNLGIIYAGQRDYVAAERYFSEALKRRPKNIIAMNWMGYLSSVKKDYKSASAWYLRAIEIDPAYADAHLNLAMLYESSMRRPKEALEHYRIYQSQTNAENTLVSAWIRNLEERINYVASNSEVDR